MIYDSSVLDFIDSKVLFIENRSTGDDLKLGGAIYSRQQSVVNFSNSDILFTLHTADIGGAVTIVDSTMMTFVNNSKVDFNKNSAAVGGAIAAGAAFIRSANSFIKFEQNISTPLGGGVGGAVALTPNSRWIDENGTLTFERNSAFNGGALYVTEESTAHFSMNSIINITNNSAKRGGGAYIDNSYINVSNSQFYAYGNKAISTLGPATDLDGADGGAVYALDSILTFSNSTIVFSSNIADKGAAIYAGASNIVFQGGNIIFEGNKSLTGNGIIEWNNGSKIEFKALANLTARLNEAENGAFLYISGEDFQLQAKTIDISSNRVSQTGKGGAIYAENSSFSFNAAGGVIKMSYNSTNGDGGAVYAEGSTISFINSASVFEKNNAQDNSGGVFYLSKSSLTIADASFIDNSAIGGRGGVFYLKDSSVKIEAIGGDIVFDGNKANLGNDFYLDGNVFTNSVNFYAGSGRAISLNGGIESAGGKNYLIKTGEGDLTIENDAKINVDAGIKIESGRLIFKTPQSSAQFSAQSALLEMSTQTTLGISVDFQNNKITSLYADSIIIASASVILTVDTKTPAPIEEYSLPFLYAGSASVSEPLAFLSVDGGRRYQYSFEWQSGGDLGSQYSYIGYLIFQKTLFPESAGRNSFYANLRVLPADNFLAYPLQDGRRIYLDPSGIFGNAEEGNNESQKLWISADFSNSKRKGDNLSAGNFKTSALGFYAGYDIFKDGGFFIFYQAVQASQNSDSAAAGDIGAGLYKSWKIKDFLLTGGYLSFGHQSFDVSDGADFSANTLKFLLESEYFNVKIPVNLFLSLRGAYTANGEIDASETKFDSDSYFKTEILGGVKKSRKLSNQLRAMGKLYAGIPLFASESRPSVYSGGIEYLGAKQNSFFGGAGIKGEYDLQPMISLFAGLNAEFGTNQTGYGLYFGLSAKIDLNASKTKEFKENLKEETDKADGSLKEKQQDLDKADIAKETEEKTTEIISENEAQAIRNAAVLSFKLSGALFDINSRRLRQKGRTDIKKMADAIKKIKVKKILIEGHSDSLGSEKVNMSLSQQRAQAVLEEFVKNGIERESMEIAAYGASRPSASNKTQRGRQLNRRVEIFVDGEAEDRDADSVKNVFETINNEENVAIKDAKNASKESEIKTEQNSIADISTQEQNKNSAEEIISAPKPNPKPAAKRKRARR